MSRLSFQLATVLLASLSSTTLLAEQICDTTLPETAPASRFVDNGDGTVSDSASGLMWRKCVEGVSGNSCDAGQELVFTWQGGLQRVDSQNAVTASGYNDWRLPNIKELATLAELACYLPATNLTVFPNQPADIDTNLALTWSSSPSSKEAFAWGVQFVEGEVAQANKNNTGFVRLVRN